MDSSHRETSFCLSTMEKNNELFELMVQKEAWAEVLRKGEAQLADKEKELSDRLDEICQSKSSFCDEVNEFDENYGILSQWWNSMTLSLEDPLLGRHAKERQQQKIMNDKKLQDIEMVKKEIDVIEKNITEVKRKLSSDEETLQQLNSQIEYLKKQPFSTEFLRSYSPNNAPGWSGNLVTTLQERSINSSNAPTIGTPPKTGNSTNSASCKVIKMFEKTTFVFKRPTSTKCVNYEQDLPLFQTEGNEIDNGSSISAQKLRKVNRNESENLEKEAAQPWVDSEDDTITHY